MNKSNTGWASPTYDIVEKQKTCIAGEPSDPSRTVSDV